MNWKYLIASPLIFILGIFLYKHQSRQQKIGGYSPTTHAKGWVFTFACFFCFQLYFSLWPSYPTNLMIRISATKE